MRPHFRNSSNALSVTLSYCETKPVSVSHGGIERTASPTGFFRVPGLLVRLSSKGLGNDGVDPDSVWSPTSTLVGLGLVDALTADAGKKVSFIYSIRPFLGLGLPNNKPAATPDEVADSEEYTCVIARGANPRTTHIFGGSETLEVRRGGAPSSGGCGKVVFTVEPFTERPSAALAPAGVASGRCRCCMRRLSENRDIFIYKGEKAFCSNECREVYIEDAQELGTLDRGSSSTAFFLGEDW